MDCSTAGFPKTSVYTDPSNGLWTGSASFWVNTTSTADTALLGTFNAGANTGVVLAVNENGAGAVPAVCRCTSVPTGGKSQSGLPDRAQQHLARRHLASGSVYMVASDGYGSGRL